MGALDQTQSNLVLNGVLTGTTTGHSTTPMKVQLGSNTPSNTVNQTQLANGNGYTTGGLSCTFAAATLGASSNTTVLTWTNTVGGWTINGIEIWDSAGTPLRWMYGTWIGAPISVAAGNTFQVASGGIAVTIV